MIQTEAMIQVCDSDTAGKPVLELKGAQLIDPAKSPKLKEYSASCYQNRERKGVTSYDADPKVRNHNIFGMMMVQRGDADGLISGLTQHYPDTLRPALQIIGKKDGVNKIAGLYMLIFKHRTVFIGDATVSIESA